MARPAKPQWVRQMGEGPRGAKVQVFALATWPQAGLFRLSGLDSTTGVGAKSDSEKQVRGRLARREGRPAQLERLLHRLDAARVAVERELLQRGQRARGEERGLSRWKSRAPKM